ncbi:ribosome-associated translation inhibitor RaiA [Aciduricibacillus chroicocephali]|uniref:Ribosome hibernation promoting factor n=1 Tax=Aciduricibacillus chroicocephali TaxID=3054939 RepID=A0ABY9KWI8_9BACI|nr:ribosome-associated translation inhibitor RaiA [Bacillaceae bacterium 44XB]
MRYNIRGENVEVTDAIKTYIEKKVGKLERYFNHTPTSDVHVNLSVFNDEQRIEITIPMTDLLLRADVRHNDLYAAVDLAVDKLERQIRKYKTRVNRKNRQQGSAKIVFAELEQEANEQVVAEDDQDGVEIVRTKRFDLKPMDSEEAVLQMDLLGHAFFVFENAENGSTNIVYRRNDGRYGLIEPS